MKLLECLLKTSQVLTQIYYSVYTYYINPYMDKNKEIRPFWTDFITFYQIITRSSGARHMPSPSLTSNSL